MRFSKHTFHTCTLIAVLSLAGCAAVSGGTLDIVVEDGVFIAEGEIGSDTPDLIADMLDDHPEITRLVLAYVPGSMDDAANLEAARMIRDAGLTTVVPKGGLVASGGTDLFLSGASRILGPGACVGVHSWAAGEGFTARDLARDDAEHDLYLDYYVEMQIDPDFYWFTLDAAPAESIHWMTRDELAQFNMATETLPDAATNPKACDAL